MNNFAESLNEILTKAYRQIIKSEEFCLKKMSNSNLSMNEMHMIDFIGKFQSNGVSISDIAEELDITRPSATIAVSKLERKGYVKKKNSMEDKRVVYVVLTEEGVRIMDLHSKYHKEMVNGIGNKFSNTEKKYLMEVIQKLNNFFVDYNGENKK